MAAAEILHLKELPICLPVTPLKCPTEDKPPKKFADWVDEDYLSPRMRAISKCQCTR